MKKSRIIQLFSIITMAAAGVFGFVGNKLSKKTEVVSAATNSVTLAGSFNSWNTSADPLTLDGDYWVIEQTLAVNDTFKIVVNGSDWVGDGDGVSWCSGLGSEGKGNNFKVLTAGTYLIKAVKTIGDYGDKSYGIVFENVIKYTVNFYTEYGASSSLIESKTVSKGNSVSCDIPNKPDSGRNHYTADKWRDSSGNDKSSALADVQSNLDVYASYIRSDRAGRYLVTGDFSIANGYYMDTVNNQLEVTVTLAYEQAFKIVYWTGSDILWINDGYSSFSMSAEAYHYFGGDNDNNLVCYAAGTYTFYYSTGDPYSIDYSVEKFISAAHVGDFTAQHLVAILLQYGDYPDSNTCSTRFPGAKEFYLNNLSAAEKSTFQGYASYAPAHRFRKAYERYVAWARALGQDPWTNTSANSPLIFVGINAKTTSVVAILVIISLVSVTTVGGYFFYKKRKENN